MGEPLNTQENDATIGLSADGQTIFTYYGKKGGDIKISEKKGEKWTVPSMFSEINTPNGHECAASFSYDGNTVYFVSDNTERVTNYGQHDIFMIVIGLIIGVVIGLLVSRILTKKYLKKNPPINEAMIRQLIIETEVIYYANKVPLLRNGY